MLFHLAIDPLHRLLHLTTVARLPTPLLRRFTKLRISMYADDALIFFLKSIRRDVKNLAEILDNIRQIAGLCTNIAKCSVAPIRCENLDLDDVLQDFQATKGCFLVKYLGLPIFLGRLRKVDIQPIMDKTVNTATTWQGCFIAMAGRSWVRKSTLHSYPTHILAYSLPKGRGKDQSRSSPRSV
jgi:hypothetical protein